jgi:transcriptional regulator with XRE-family HTH domain
MIFGAMTTFDRDAFAKRLDALAIERQLNQRALARAVGTHYNVVSCWLRGERLPTTEHLAALATALGTTLDWLVLGESPADDEIARRLAIMAPEFTELAQMADEAAGHADD